MKVFIEVEMENDAFDDGYRGLKELNRILNSAIEKLAYQMDRPPALCDAPEASDKLLDINGNTVGSVRIDNQIIKKLEAENSPDARDESRWPDPTEEEPDFETLQRWSFDGVAEATDGCTVEPDGMCDHYHPSWLIRLGLI